MNLRLGFFLPFSFTLFNALQIRVAKWPILRPEFLELLEIKIIPQSLTLKTR